MAVVHASPLTCIAGPVGFQIMMLHACALQRSAAMSPGATHAGPQVRAGAPARTQTVCASRGACLQALPSSGGVGDGQADQHRPLERRYRPVPPALPEHLPPQVPVPVVPARMRPFLLSPNATPATMGTLSPSACCITLVHTFNGAEAGGDGLCYSHIPCGPLGDWGGAQAPAPVLLLVHGCQEVGGVQAGGSGGAQRDNSPGPGEVGEGVRQGQHPDAHHGRDGVEGGVPPPAMRGGGSCGARMVASGGSLCRSVVRAGQTLDPVFRTTQDPGKGAGPLKAFP